MRRGLIWGVVGLLLLLLGGVLAPLDSVARQLRFDKRDEGGEVAFSYRYQDSARRSEEIEFSLSHATIQESQLLLLDRSTRNRAASDFMLSEGRKTAAKRVVALRADFEAEIADLQRSIETFNAKLGTEGVSLTLTGAQRVDTTVDLSENKIWVRYHVPQMRYKHHGKALFAKLAKNTEEMLAQANKNLPEGLRLVFKRKKTGGISYSVKDDGQTYRQTTRARANRIIKKTNAHIRKLFARYDKDSKKIDKFYEGIEKRVNALHAETFQRLSLVRKDVLADMKAKKAQFYVAHYLIPSKNDEKRTLIDYVRIAEQAYLQPVAQAFRKKTQGKSEREQVAEVLRFFQNIPYNDLMKGKIRGFTGFSPPVELIAQNLGDCDSKSTAVMALLHLLLEESSVAIFLVPGHAFLGVEIEPKKGDAVHTHEGKTYVLMEAAGPWILPVGSLFKFSKRHMKAGRIEDIVTLSPQ